jgi:hypothetical protein
MASAEQISQTGRPETTEYHLVDGCQALPKRMAVDTVISAPATCRRFRIWEHLVVFSGALWQHRQHRNDIPNLTLMPRSARPTTVRMVDKAQVLERISKTTEEKGKHSVHGLIVTWAPREIPTQFTGPLKDTGGRPRR